MNDSGPQVLVWPHRRAAETAPQDVLALCELRAALVRSGWAGARQGGQGDGREVVRTRGVWMYELREDVRTWGEA